MDPPTPGSIVTARAELALPEILKSSIEVNRKGGRDSETDYSSVLLGAVAMQNDVGDVEVYAVRSVVEMGKNKTPVLVEYGVIGSLHASNAKKQMSVKIGSPKERRAALIVHLLILVYHSFLILSRGYLMILYITRLYGATITFVYLLYRRKPPEL